MTQRFLDWVGGLDENTAPADADKLYIRNDGAPDSEYVAWSTVMQKAKDETNAARYNALELLSRTSLWTAQDASGSDLPSRTAALPATLTGLTRVDGPCVVLPGTADNFVNLGQPDLTGDCVAEFPLHILSGQGAYEEILSDRGGTLAELAVRFDAAPTTDLNVLWYEAGVAKSVTLAHGLGANESGRFRVVRDMDGGGAGTASVALQMWDGSTWSAVDSDTVATGGTATNSGVVLRLGGLTAPAPNLIDAAVRVWTNATATGTPAVEIEVLDIASSAGTATTLAGYAVNRATSGRQTQIVPRGSVLVNSDPDTTTNTATASDGVDVAATDDVLLLVACQIGNDVSGFEKLITSSASGNKVNFYRNTTAGQLVGAFDTVINGAVTVSETGRILAGLYASRSSNVLTVFAVAEDGTVSSTSGSIAAIDEVVGTGAVVFGAGAELTYAAAIGTGIGLADLVDDDTLIALHDLLALQKWDEVEALSAAVGGMTPTERDKLTGLGERVFIPATSLFTTAASLSRGATTVPYLEFDDDADEYAYTADVVLPGAWRTFSVRLHWSAATNTGSVYWSAHTRQIASGATLTPTASVHAAAVTAPATASTLNVTTLPTNVTVTSADRLNLYLGRLGTNGGDTMSGDAWLIGVELVRTS